MVSSVIMRFLGLVLLTLSQNANWSCLGFLEANTLENKCKLLDYFGDSSVLTFHFTQYQFSFLTVLFLTYI